MGGCSSGVTLSRYTRFRRTSALHSPVNYGLRRTDTIQTRADGGRRIGIEVDGDAVFGRFEPGTEEPDPGLIWYVDIRCRGENLPVKADAVKQWLLSQGKTNAAVEQWAQQLIDAQDTDAIVTPVYIESIAGVANKVELELSRAFLGKFRIVDEERIIPEDWQEARRLAQRVPRNGKRRQLGDCLIAAIANRLHYEVISLDEGFPR